MADFDSSLPVRTQTNGDVVNRLVDGLVTSQFLGIDAAGKIGVKLSDAAGTALTSTLLGGTKQSLDVNIANTAPIQVSGTTDSFPATQNITAQDIGSTSTPSGNQTFVTGSPTAGSVASFTLSSNETVMLESTGTWTGTLQTEISVDGGTTWVAHSIHLIGSPLFQTSFTANFIGSMNVAAKTQVRVRSTASWTGTATVKAILSANASTIYVANAIKLVDSSANSTVQAQILAASTAASAANTSLVVAISPNSPLPAGSATIGAVNQGTSPWIVKDQADGPVTPGTVASFSQLIGGQFNTALPTLSTGQQAAVQLDSSGRLIIAPLAATSIVTVSNLPTTVDTNYGTVGASTLRSAAQIGNATGAANFGAGATGAQTLRVEANQGAAATTANGWPVKPTDGTNSQSYTAAGSAKIDIEQVSGATQSATNPLFVELTDGAAAISKTNPLPVYLQDGGTSINDYNTNAALAAAGTSNHDYTVTAAKTFHLGQIHASSSGKLKIEVQVETGVATNTFTSKFVGFNSTSTPNIDLTLAAFLDVAAGVRVRVIRTNRDLLPQDVYSTICGHEQ